MKALPKKIRFGQFFGIVAFLVVIIFSGVATTIQIYRDFEEAKAARIDHQNVVSKLAVQTLRAPLIQGSFVEVRLRAQSIIQNSQVACVTITAKDVPVTNCESDSEKKASLYAVTDEVFYDEAQSVSAATVTLYFDNSDIYQSLRQKIQFAVVGNSALALLVLGILLFASRIIKRDLKTIILECERRPSQETPIYLAEFSYLREKINFHMDAAEVNAETRASGELARQVKHDIRSPLAALNNTIKSLVLPADKKALIQSAIKRINDIANDLHRSKSIVLSEEIENQHTEIKNRVSEIVFAAVEEKKIQYRDRAGLAFDLRISSEAQNLTCALDSKELNRILSNVLDNSAEAIKSEGLIRVDLFGDAESVRLLIVDTGVGVPPELIPTLGAKGKTFGKENGSGLGLYHAINTLEGVGGSLTINSDGISGTCVEMQIPLSQRQETSAKIL
ncbi:MAG: HAMP domain-containing histidine kinase [Bdellovibrionaceae bacterium]|nr:HAMP domain-containing histidine kinase [Pseudobdellovibrionaceae bacterium]MBX3039932.1 HAMP domain-containing histidine kinase [Pseudobdellovibrionaceae bacterium]